MLKKNPDSTDPASIQGSIRQPETSDQLLAAEPDYVEELISVKEES